MGLYKRKDSKSYWMSFKVKGNRVFESTGTANKKLAERIHAKRALEISEGKWFLSESRKRTFEELQERYMKEHSKVNKVPKSYSRDQTSFRHLSNSFKGHVLSELTPSKISDYKATRRTAGAQLATIHRELEVLRHALNLAIREWEWLERNPFERVKFERLNNKKERWLTAAEEKRLLESSPEWLREVIVFALNTGMRQDEILSLQWSQVDMARRTVTLLITKNKEKRTIPLNRIVAELLKTKSRVMHISGYVFTSGTGTKIDARNLLRAFYKARKSANLEDFRFHDLRHTFATRLVQSGIDLYVVKELLGHKTITMTMRYAHHYPESLRHGVEVLEKNGYVLVTEDVKDENVTDVRPLLNKPLKAVVNA